MPNKELLAKKALLRFLAGIVIDVLIFLFAFPHVQGLNFTSGAGSAIMASLLFEFLVLAAVQLIYSTFKYLGLIRNKDEIGRNVLIMYIPTLLVGVEMLHALDGWLGLSVTSFGSAVIGLLLLAGPTAMLQRPLDYFLAD